MIRILTLLLLAIPLLASAQDVSPQDAYETRVDNARKEYRRAIAKLIRESSAVELVLLRFDDVKKLDPFDDEESRFPVAPYNATTSVISTKMLSAEERNPLLGALANQIEKPSHTGGAFCHYPVHGIRVYSKPKGDAEKGDIVYDGSFCWVCKNFGFSYPDGADWLDTNSDLDDILNRLLPIPAEELKRFRANFKTEPTGER
jgi:hypothetical protein